MSTTQIGSRTAVLAGAAVIGMCAMLCGCALLVGVLAGPVSTALQIVPSPSPAGPTSGPFPDYLLATPLVAIRVTMLAVTPVPASPTPTLLPLATPRATPTMLPTPTRTAPPPVSPLATPHDLPPTGKKQTSAGNPIAMIP
jgi:hypothetical protein